MTTLLTRLTTACRRTPVNLDDDPPVERSSELQELRASPQQRSSPLRRWRARSTNDDAGIDPVVVIAAKGSVTVMTVPEAAIGTAAVAAETTIRQMGLVRSARLRPTDQIVSVECSSATVSTGATATRCVRR